MIQAAWSTLLHCILIIFEYTLPQPFIVIHSLRMDVFVYRASHKVNTEGVFVATGSDTEIGGLFLRMKNGMTTELHLQWDLVFLQQDISEQMVPRSLRWEVETQQGETDLDSWFKY